MVLVEQFLAGLLLVLSLACLGCAANESRRKIFEYKRVMAIQVMMAGVLVVMAMDSLFPERMPGPWVSPLCFLLVLAGAVYVVRRYGRVKAIAQDQG